MKKFLSKLKSCYCPRPTDKKKLPKSLPSSDHIHRHPLYSATYQIHKRRRRDWEPALSDITEDSREDGRDSTAHNDVVTKPQKKPNVVTLPSDDYKNNREWWKSMPIMVSTFAFSMS